MLPKGICQQDHATYETLELAERESSFDWTLRSHCPCGDRVSHCRATGADARSLLGGNRDSGCDAIHSRRYADALRRAHRCHRRWRVSRSSRGKLFRSKSRRLHARDLFHRPTFVWLSTGEDRLSICQCQPDDHCFDSADKSRVDRRPASIHRSFSRDHRDSRCCSFLAGTVCDSSEERSGIICCPRDATGASRFVSAWKRGSFRSGSNIGSSRSSAGVSGTPDGLLYGIESSFCKAAMARSVSPVWAATRARISITWGPSNGSFSIGIKAMARSIILNAEALSPRLMSVSARSPSS